MGAEQCGRCWVIPRGLLMARLRELEQSPHYQWETVRRERVARAIEQHRQEALRRGPVIRVSAAERERLSTLTCGDLPGTISLAPGEVRVSGTD